MGFFDTLDDKKKSGETSRDRPGHYVQAVIRVEEATTRAKHVPMLRIHKVVKKVLSPESELGVGDETTDVIVASEYSETDVRKLYCGLSGDNMRDANNTPFSVIRERMETCAKAHAQVEVKVQKKPKKDEEGYWINTHYLRPVDPEE